MGVLLPHNTSITITHPVPFITSSRFAALLFPFSPRSIIINPTSSRSFSSSSSSSQFHLHRSFLGFHSKLITRSSRCHATNPSPPSQKSDSPLGEEDTVPILETGLEETFSKFQDRAQIFVAVLFWMSLFFWACATDGSNDGRPSKGSRFKR